MATNPPITIGPFANVPAPGSGVQSAWHQQITQYVVDHAAELVYSQIVASVPITATTAATAQNVINPGAVTYPAKPIMLEFFSGNAQTANGAGNQLIINLWDGNTDLGYWGQLINAVASGGCYVPVCLRRRLTPTAGSHNYNVRAWVTAGSGVIQASPPMGPAFLRIVGA